MEENILVNSNKIKALTNIMISDSIIKKFLEGRTAMTVRAYMNNQLLLQQRDELLQISAGLCCRSQISV